MALKLRYAQIKTEKPLVGALGAGTGLVLTELPAEFTARVAGVTGYPKAGVKTLVKVVAGIVLLGASIAAPGGWSLFGKAAAFAGMGSSLLDWLAALYPGGVPGLAERMAVTLRTYRMGVKGVASELAAMEHAGVQSRFDGNSITVSPRRTFPGQTGKYT